MHDSKKHASSYLWFPTELCHSSTIFHRSPGPVVMLVLPSWLRWMEVLASQTQILYLESPMSAGTPPKKNNGSFFWEHQKKDPLKT